MSMLLRRLAMLCIFMQPVIINANPSTEDSKEQIPVEDVQRFSTAITQIKKYYVKPISDKKLFDNAIRGMLSGLDPHSGYLDEEEFKDLQTSTDGKFGGLGIEITMEDGIIKVVSPIVDSPAFKAGIKSGDYIIKINNTAVQGLNLKDAVNLMRGKIGSKVELTVARKGTPKLLQFCLARQNIAIQSVQSKLLDNNYGYVRLAQFQSTTEKDMEKAIANLKLESHNNLRGIILDLRNNPGGLLESAIQVTDAFLSSDNGQQDKIIVYTQGRLPGSEFKATATPGDLLNNAPMVVLINGGSASASEIVAGALKDNKRAILLGTKSFGKGSVQTVLPLDEKRGIKLTTALYYTPSGNSIQARGITPDIIVEEMLVPKNSTNKNLYNTFSEASLKGHIETKNNKNVAKNSSSGYNTDNLLYEDYQLYAALNLLKGLSVASNK